MKEEICKHCDWYDKENGHCTNDYDDIIPIIAVVQCGEADKIEEKLNNHSLDNNNTKEVKHGKSKEEEVL